MLQQTGPCYDLTYMFPHHLQSEKVVPIALESNLPCVCVCVCVCVQNHQKV